MSSTASISVLGSNLTLTQSGILRETGSCWVHGTHRPPSLTKVFHHIIPREWQAKWYPPTSVHKAKRYGPYLWAPACVLVCPTGHANIHYHIKKIGEALVIYKSLNTHLTYDQCLERYTGARSREAKVAKYAFLNWRAAGGPWDTII